MQPTRRDVTETKSQTSRKDGDNEMGQNEDKQADRQKDKW